MELLGEAVLFASCAHNGMRRKNDKTPYILHPLEVATIVGTMTDDQEVLAAAVLHDTIEDAGITIDKIRDKFGDRVARLVLSETENKREELPPEQTWRIRKEESLEQLRGAEDIDVIRLWLGDKLSNLRGIFRNWRIHGDAVWQRFNQTDIGAQAWYYRSVLKLTERLSETTAWLEFKELISRMFGEET